MLVDFLPFDEVAYRAVKGAELVEIKNGDHGKFCHGNSDKSSERYVNNCVNDFELKA